jgi:hypothetical protein
VLKSCFLKNTKHGFCNPFFEIFLRNRISEKLYDHQTREMMKAITIRGFEPEVADKLKQMAINQGKSVNQLILEILKKNLGLKKDRKYSKKYDDLDHLFGKWSAEEFKRISGKINQERQIDRELWE